MCKVVVVVVTQTPAYPGTVPADVSEKEGCKCRRFFANDDEYVWHDNVGWKHTRKGCGPA